MMAAARVGGETGSVARAAAVAERIVRVVAEPGTKENPLLDVGQVARRLGVSKKTVRRLVFKRGAFPNWRRVERMVRIPELDVLAYLRKPRA